MKRIHIILAGLVGLVIMALGMASCRKGEIHGDLEGNWEIMQITAPDGADVPVIPQRYISIMRNVVQLRSEDDRITTGALTVNDPYMRIEFPYEEKENYTHPLTEWGIYSNPVEMKVVKNDKKSLVLDEDGYIIYCRRF